MSSEPTEQYRAVLELRKGSRTSPVDSKRKGRTAEKREWRRREGLSRGKRR
jgi:hypothetical protein